MFDPEKLMVYRERRRFIFYNEELPEYLENLGFRRKAADILVLLALQDPWKGPSHAASAS